MDDVQSAPIVESAQLPEAADPPSPGDHSEQREAPASSQFRWIPPHRPTSHCDPTYGAIDRHAREQDLFEATPYADEDVSTREKPAPPSNGDLVRRRASDHQDEEAEGVLKRYNASIENGKYALRGRTDQWCVVDSVMSESRRCTSMKF